MTSVPSGFARGSAAFVWNDRALFIGDRSETSTHAHHAVELSVSLDDLGIDIGLNEQSAFEGVPGAMVRAGSEHRLSIPGPKVAVLYVDPQSTTAASLHAWLGDDDLRPLGNDLVREAREGFISVLRRMEVDIEDVGRLCDAVLERFSAARSAPQLDRRVRQVMDRINAELDSPPSLDALADAVGISASRLRHMFVEQVGLPTSRYVLWMRLRAALVAALEGASMAESAQVAGFSDAAHFTRTCRQMFGLPPTAFAPVDHVSVA